MKHPLSGSCNPDKKPALTLRLAVLADAEAISRIYAPYVKDTVVSFEYDPPSADEIARRMAAMFCDYPYLVCQMEGRIVGYAYAHRLFERAAYGWNTELSVYVDQPCRGMGVGRTLMQALLKLLQMQGVASAFSAISVPNPASEGLHMALGFQKCGHFPGAGFKLGAWHDSCWYALQLTPLAVPPAPVTPFCQLDKDAVEAVLEQAVQK